jgi:hypothetical protein
LAQIFAQEPGAEQKTLKIFSDMRQSTAELDLESKPIPGLLLSKCHKPFPDLHGVHMEMSGVDASGASAAHWQNLEAFWEKFLHDLGAIVTRYSTLR